MPGAWRPPLRRHGQQPAKPTGHRTLPGLPVSRTAATAEAAERAYEGSDATPALKEVRWRYDIFKRINQGGSSRASEETDEEI